MVNSIPAREIKRRGISAVDEALKKGPVHVIKNDQPRYFVMDATQFQEWIEEREEGYIAHVTESLEDAKAGRVRYFATAGELVGDIKEAIGEDQTG